MRAVDFSTSPFFPIFSVLAAKSRKSTQPFFPIFSVLAAKSRNPRLALARLPPIAFECVKNLHKLYLGYYLQYFKFLCRNSVSKGFASSIFESVFVIKTGFKHGLVFFVDSRIFLPKCSEMQMRHVSTILQKFARLFGVHRTCHIKTRAEFLAFAVTGCSDVKSDYRAVFLSGRRISLP